MWIPAPWLPVTAAEAATVDRVIAVVDAVPILESQVRLEEELTAVDPSPLPGWTAVVPDPLERLISATVLRSVAADVALYQPTREQIDARREALRAAIGDARAWDAFLTRHGLSEDDLGTVLRRRMVVEKLLLRNLVAAPDDLERWTLECRKLLELRRPRARVRLVPVIEESAE